jgi:hypothetical protein
MYKAELPDTSITRVNKTGDLTLSHKKRSLKLVDVPHLRQFASLATASP